jgi:exosome complex component RRP41
MPLDTSTYALSLLRPDGRRWNEIRQIHAQISTQPSADGSSYLEMGNTKILCTVHGPAENRPGAGGGASAAGSRSRDDAEVTVEINFAGFSGIDRQARGRNDKRLLEMSTTLSNSFAPVLFTHLFPHSTIRIVIQVLSQDGSVLAACFNAATLALIDAGIPMRDFLAACTSGVISNTISTGNARRGGPKAAAAGGQMDPILDLNTMEETELPFLTVATLGATEEVSALIMESRVQVSELESLLSVGVDGCKRVRDMLDAVVRKHGKRLLLDGRN